MEDIAIHVSTMNFVTLPIVTSEVGRTVFSFYTGTREIGKYQLVIAFPESKVDYENRIVIRSNREVVFSDTIPSSDVLKFVPFPRVNQHVVVVDSSPQCRNEIIEVDHAEGQGPALITVFYE